MNSTVIDALGWALIHSLWQCAAIAAVFAVLNLVLQPRSANARYLAGSVSLLAMPLAAAVTFWLLSQDPQSSKAIVAISAVSGDLAPPDAAHIPSAPSPTPAPHSVPYLDLVVWFWAAGVISMSLWSAAGWLLAQRLKRRGSRKLDEQWQIRLSALARQLGIRRSIGLCESALAKVPSVIGWLKPVILVPAGALMNLSASELEAVLAHELAHIRRLDYLANLLQSAIETLMFYHPAMWWVSKHIRAERENCCDDMAIAACGDRIVYARALTALEELRGTFPPFALAATGGPLLARIRRLLGRDESRRRSLPVWMALATLLVAGLAGSSGLRLHAQATPSPDRVTPYAAPRAAGSIRAGFATAASSTPRASSVAMQPSSEGATSTARPVFAPPPSASAPFASAGTDERAGMYAAPSAASAPGAAAVEPSIPQSSAAPAALPAYRGSELLAAAQKPADAPAPHREGFLAGLVDAGYTQISVDEIVALRDNGVDSKYIAGMLHAGFGTPTPKDLINLHNNGVSPKYAAQAVASGIPKLTVESLIALAQNGVNLECIRRIHAAGFGPFGYKDAIELQRNGVPAELFEALKEAGYTNIDARQAVTAQQNGLSARSLHSLRDQGFKGLTFEQVIKLCRAGVI